MEVFPKDLEEQKDLYFQKQEYLSKNYQPIEPFDFYRLVFPKGTIGPRGDYENVQGHPMMQIWWDKVKKDGSISYADSGKGGGFRKYELIFDDLSRIKRELPISPNEKAISNPKDTRKSGTIYVSPISYFGKKVDEERSRYKFAFVVDLDDVTVDQIQSMELYIKRGLMPEPSLVVHSGTGLHLYFLLAKPEPMYRMNRMYFDKIQTCLRITCCNDATTLKVVDKLRGARGGDELSIVQQYRAPGSKTKLGRDFLATAFKFSDKRYELSDFFPFFRGDKVPEPPEVFFSKKEYNTTPLERAKQLWPEWYERRIVQGEPKKTWKNSKVNRGCYDWWLKEIRTNDKVRVGIRYNCIFTLAIFAAKYHVPFEELERDANGLLEYLDSIGKTENHNFTQADIDEALTIYYYPNVNYYTRQKLEKKTWEFGTKNRRNGRTREENLKRARAVQNIDYPEGNWRNLEGRPAGSGTAQNDVLAWRAEHPTGTKSQCKKETGISYPTIRKWWDTTENVEN